MKEEYIDYICDVCSKPFDTKQKLAGHRKGPGKRCGYVNDVPIPMFPQNLNKRAASSDTTSVINQQRRRTVGNGIPEDHSLEYPIIPEEPSLEYRIIDNEDEEVESRLSSYRG